MRLHRKQISLTGNQVRITNNLLNDYFSIQCKVLPPLNTPNRPSCVSHKKNVLILSGLKDQDMTLVLEQNGFSVNPEDAIGKHRAHAFISRIYSPISDHDLSEMKTVLKRFKDYEKKSLTTKEIIRAEASRHLSDSRIVMDILKIFFVLGIIYFVAQQL